MKNPFNQLSWQQSSLLGAGAALVWALFYFAGHHLWDLTITPAHWRYHVLFVLITTLFGWLATQNFFAPVDKKTETPLWFYRWGRIIIGWWLLAMPFLYDLGVPEVGGDLRWQVTHVTVLILCTLGLLALWQKKKPLTLAPYAPLLLWCFAGLIVTASLSFADTINPYRSWWFYKHFLSFIGIAGFIYLLRSPAWYRTLIWLMVLPVGPVALLGICQFMDFGDAQIAATVGSWWTTLWEPINTLRKTYPQAAIPGGTFSNKNLLASWLVLLWPLILYLLITAKNWPVRLLSSVWLSLALVALIFTRSRASWVSFVVAVVFFTLWVLSQKALRAQIRSFFTWRTGVSLLGVLAVVAYCFPLTSPLKTTYAINISVEQQAKNITRVKDFGPRIAYNINGLKMIADHPFLGIGIGAFHTAYPPYHNALYPTPHNGYNIEARPQRTHDDLLQAFIEQGIPGGLLHIMVIVLLVQAAWRLAHPARVSAVGVLPAFIVTGIVGLGLNAMGDFPLQMPIAPAMLFSFFGLLAGYARLHQQLPSVGWPHKTLTLPRPVIGFLLVVTATATLFIVQDDYHRRMGAYHLKQAMARNMAGAFDTLTLREIRQSYNIYPWNARMQEFRGIIYALYNGKQPLTQERRAEVMRQAMRHDPYAANHKINLANLLQQMADRDEKLGNKAAAEEKRKEMDKLVEALMVLAPNSHHTWNLAGLLANRRGDNKKAADYYIRSLQVTHANKIAVQALRSMGYKIVPEQKTEEKKP